MKKGFLAALIGVMLVGCTPTQPNIPPAESVTGYWTGSLSQYGIRVDISTRLALTNTPNPGDFAGKGQLRNAVSIDDATVSGNVNTGRLVAQKGSDVVSCTGKFKENNQYNGDCTYNGRTAPLYMYRQGD